MDMDVVAEGTEPPTRATSPTPGKSRPSLAMSKPDEGTKTPGLMKGLRKDVEQGAAEFDMDKFFASDAGKGKDVPALVTSPATTSGSATPAFMTAETTPLFGVQFADSFGGATAPATALKPESVSPGSPRSRALSPGSRSPAARTPRGVSPARSGTGTPARKGANLMKDVMAGTQAEQGGTEFSFDSFFPSTAATPKPAGSDKPPEEKVAEADEADAKGEDKPKDGVEPKDEDKPKGLSLMKETNAHTQSAQGGAEFSFDNFFPGVQAPAPVRPSTPPRTSPRKSGSTPSSPTAPGRPVSRVGDEASNGEQLDKVEEDKPKGLSLMKETNAHTQSAQGGTEFSFDSFFPSDPAPQVKAPQPKPEPKEAGHNTGSKPEVRAELETEDTAAPRIDDKAEDKASDHSPEADDSPAAPEREAKPATPSSPSTPDSDTPKTMDVDTLPNTDDKDSASTPASETEARKGANLMKDLNPNANAAQGGAEFNFDDFF